MTPQGDITAIGAMVALLSAPFAQAETAASFAGEWCHPDWGTALFWDAFGIGLGEHTICQWEAPPSADLFYSTALSCETMVPDGKGGWQGIDPKTHQFRATRLGDGTLEVQFNDEAPIPMTRCDH